MNSDIKFDEVKEIKIIDSYNKKNVYDFSVKDNETFCLTNGLYVHNTLNTFHMAGVASKSNVNQGVPRLRELISITKNPKTPSLTIYLKQDINTEEKAMNALSKIQKVSFDYFVQSTKIIYDPMIYNNSSNIEEDKEIIRDFYDFYSTFDFLSYDNTKLSPWVLRINIHPLFLLSKNMRMIELFYKLKKNIEDYYSKDKFSITYSDENENNNIIHIRFKYDDIYKKVIDNDEIYITNNDIHKLKELESYIMEDLIIKGNKNITNAYIREIKEKYIKKNDGSIQTKNTFIIDTVGSDLDDIITNYNFLDKTKIISNDVHEMYEKFGIEATRELLKNEITNIIKHNGIYINKRHIGLLVNLMTYKGFLNSIDRHGMNKADAGPLTKMSFEEAESQLSAACVSNQEDMMNSITSNLIMGQVGKYGTGFAEVIFDDSVFN